MAWESRKRGGRYYTRSRKAGGRVVREYVGGGELGEMAAWFDDTERAEREATAEQVRAKREQLDALDATMRDYCRQVDALMRAELTAAGYHQHARGEWRRKRANTHNHNEQD